MLHDPTTLVFIAVQLITYGALRQAVKDIARGLEEQKARFDKLEDRVLKLELRGNSFSAAGGK